MLAQTQSKQAVELCEIEMSGVVSIPEGEDPKTFEDYVKLFSRCEHWQATCLPVVCEHCGELLKPTDPTSRESVTIGFHLCSICRLE